MTTPTEEAIEKLWQKVYRLQQADADNGSCGKYERMLRSFDCTPEQRVRIAAVYSWIDMIWYAYYATKALIEAGDLEAPLPPLPPCPWKPGQIIPHSISKL